MDIIVRHYSIIQSIFFMGLGWVGCLKLDLSDVSFFVIRIVSCFDYCYFRKKGLNIVFYCFLSCFGTSKQR